MFCSRKQKLETMINEVEHLQRLRHPHIIQLVGSYLQGKKFAILLYPVAQWNLSSFLELCQEANTKRDITSNKPELEALPGFFQCLSHALANIHANNMKHMDIKPQNVLVRAADNFPDGYRVYLADFGISKKFAADELSQTDGVTALTRKYCAPEVYNGDLRGRSADIFSLGCVFLEMATVMRGLNLDDLAEFRSRTTYTSDGNSDEPYHMTLGKVAAWIEEHLRLSTYLDDTYEKGYDIRMKIDDIAQMLSGYPGQRPTASLVLERMGGARTCCIQEREAYEAEEEE